MPVAERLLETKPVTPELPNLKKGEKKEKRGAGFLWPGSAAAPAGGGFLGASSEGFLGLGRVAAFIARALGGSSSVLGRLLLSKAGTWLVLGGLAAGGAAVVGVASWVTSSFAPATRASTGTFTTPVLDGVHESIRIHRPQDTSLNNLKSNPGEEPDYGQIHKEAPSAEPPPAVKAEGPAAPVPPINEAKDAMLQEAKKQGLDVSKLSGLAGLVGNSGSGGMPSGLPDLSKQTLGGSGNDFKLHGNFVPASNFVKLKSITPFDNKVPLTSTREGHEKATSPRAMGQLKFASDMSHAGSAAGVNEVGKTYSTDAFEQGKTVGGVMQGEADGIVTPNPNPAPNNIPNGTNVTPYQNQITSAQQNSGVSAALKVAGMAAIAAGIALIIAGIALLPFPTTPIGIGLIMAGLALVMAGLAMLAQSANMAHQAQNQGQNINNQYGQQTQANIVNQCSQQANQQGIQPQNCTAQFQMPGDSVQQDTQAESQSTYNLGGGAPMH